MRQQSNARWTITERDVVSAQMEIMVHHPEQFFQKAFTQKVTED